MQMTLLRLLKHYKAMDTIYIEYVFTVTPKEPASEILIAELGNAGFESFVENKNGVTAYIQKNDWNDKILSDVYCLSDASTFRISFTQKEIPQTNWNIEWEKNFNPIAVNKKVCIRAPFHEPMFLDYDIVIEPKMSFGTGHHETTHLMIQYLLELELINKKVLDMGCGTGILAIFSEMKGAKPIDAIDIDQWCFENSEENIARNHCEHISVFLGDVSLLTNKTYDVIIANINRNILLNDMQAYAQCLDIGGILLLSGFYKEDIDMITSKASKYGLQLQSTKERANWVALKLLKA